MGLITLTGMAHCGKTTISDLFMKSQNKLFNPTHVKKYTTRKPRENDTDVICVSELPKACDLVYEQYGVRYGVELKSIYNLLEKGKTPIIILNDIRAIEDIKALLGDMVLSAFIYRTPADINEFTNEERGRASEKSKDEIRRTAEIRYEKAKAIYRIYIENIQLFDKVILNVADVKYTQRQINHIVDELTRKTKALAV